MTEHILPSAKQIAALQDLGNMLEFGEEQFTKLVHDTKRLGSLDQRKTLIITLFAASHSHTQSMMLLLQKGGTHSSETIARTLLESWVNAQYIACADDDSHAANFVYREKLLSRSNYAHMREFRDSNPTLDTGTFISNDEIDIAISQLDKSIAELKGKFSVKSHDTRTKMQIIDKILGKGGENYRPIEWSYFHTYHILSNTTHVTFHGLGNFFSKSGDELSFFLGGNPKKIATLIMCAYVLYFDVLNLFFDVFELDKDKLDVFEGKIESITELT